MSLSLESDHLAFFLRLPHGSWDLHLRPDLARFLEGARMSARWRNGSGLRTWGGEMPAATHGPAVTTERLPHPSQHKALTWTLDGESVAFELELMLDEELPRFLWRLGLENRSQEPIFLEDFEMMAVGPRHARRGIVEMGRFSRRLKTEAAGCLRVEASPSELAFHSNGWQSWSYTGTLGEADRQPMTRLGSLRTPVSLAPGAARWKDRGRFSSDMYAVIGSRGGQKGLLSGFLSQNQAFGWVECVLNRHNPHLRIRASADGARLDPGCQFQTDWACLQFIELQEADPLETYMMAVGEYLGARIPETVPVGWCSWYQFFEKVTWPDLKRNLSWIEANQAQVPLGLFQVDDGYQKQVGDWNRTKPGFLDSMRAAGERIAASGLTPGLWLAPFLVHPRADLASDHPDWILRGGWGRPVAAGYNWDSFVRALDVSNPEVLAHLQSLVRTAAQDWGYRYLKLDFLYAGGLSGKRHNVNLTNAQALRGALLAIRQAAGEGVHLVGCGCPLGSGIGIFDSMRVGPDVAPRWEAAYRGIELFFKREPDLPSVKNALRNVLHRSAQHRRWWLNDPDCLLLRSSGSHLSRAEVRTLATVLSLSAGSLLISDDLVELADEPREWLSSLLPPLPSAAVVRDWFDRELPCLLTLDLAGAGGKWSLIAMINWDASPSNRVLDLSRLGMDPARKYHAFEFWSREYCTVGPEDDPIFGIEPHGVRLLALRPVSMEPQWVGDSLHVSQGLPLVKWESRRDGLLAEIELGRRARGTIWLHIPGIEARVLVDGEVQPHKRLQGALISVDLTVDSRANLQVERA